MIGSESEKLLAIFGKIVGPEFVREASTAQKMYGLNTLSAQEVPVAGAVLPKTTEEVVSVIEAAGRCSASIYPISRGNNWGYGSKSPGHKDSFVLDLSRMNRIIAFDPITGIITLEPGVSTAEVERYLSENDYPFVAPVTGAGPTSSMIGNLLEKGLSLTPAVERASSLTSITVVMPDASVFDSRVESTDYRTSSPFKFGSGPYLDGLFLQSALGVVVRADIRLARKPSHVTVMHIPISETQSLEQLLLVLNDLMGQLPGIVSYFQIEGSVRSFGHFNSYNPRLTDARGVLRKEFIMRDLRRLNLGAKNCLASLQGPQIVVKAAKKIIKTALLQKGFSSSFTTRETLEAYRQLTSVLPAWVRRRWSYLKLASMHLDRSIGKNSSRHSWFPLWRHTPYKTPSHIIDQAARINMDEKEYCGLLFFVATFSPATPVTELLKEIESACREAGVDPLLALLGLPEGYMHISLQLSFDKRDAGATRRAHECYRRIFRLAVEGGMFPYRIPQGFQDLLSELRPDFWPLAKRIKSAIDPHNIISPGRYEPSR